MLQVPDSLAALGFRDDGCGSAMNPTASLLLDTLAPGLLVAGVALVAMPWLRPNDERARAIVVAVVVVLMWRYMIWRWVSTLPPV